MEKVINFTKLRYVMFTISISFITIFWVGTFLQGGFNFGIDFQAGLNQRIMISNHPDVSEGDIKAALEGIESLQVQSVGNKEDHEFMVRVGVDKTVDNFQSVAKADILSKLDAAFGKDSVEIRSSDFVGPRFAGSLTSQTIFLTAFALLLILVYIWIRFKLNYAVSAIIAIFHDVLFLLGFIGITQIDFSTATIAAVLTIIGYSLNDTIVIFDRIRENTRIVKSETFEETINFSITRTLSRTIITSLTTLIAVLAIFILATGSIKLFALNLIVGIVVGTYSSIYIASSILLSWHNVSVKRSAKKVKGNKEQGKVVKFNKA